ncbi:hypothetical protein QWY77_07050 [Thalassotalea ponticola]|uniref:hypothetical protein n=1 Tax=Thalassotalea ponticola TaxID=1523392 RepID=UPI0025B4AB73|nr:hypothetical protein [Thalassotalea ponticola]MDN3652521.1 hypothetical protein [Thalassotalea ponticola]
MTDPLKQIWHNDEQQEYLNLPKIKNLYTQKSQSLIERFERSFAINILGIAIGATLVAGYFIYQQLYLLTLFIVLSGAWMTLLGKKNQRLLQHIDKQQDTFHYLQTFDDWLEAMMQQYDKLYRVFYPLLFLVVIAEFNLASVETIESITTKVPFVSVFILDSVGHVLTVIGISALLCYLGPAIFRFDMKMTYGDQLKTLKQTLADMRSLQS